MGLRWYTIVDLSVSLDKIMSILLIVISTPVTGILAAAGVLKIHHRQQFKESVISWGLATYINRPLTVLLPLIELILAGAVLRSMLSGSPQASVYWAVAGFFAVLALAQAWIYRRATKAHCGCFGRPVPLDQRSTARALSLALGVGVLAIWISLGAF